MYFGEILSYWLNAGCMLARGIKVNGEFHMKLGIADVGPLGPEPNSTRWALHVTTLNTASEYCDKEKNSPLVYQMKDLYT